MSGRWIAATLLLGRDVLVGERYPHICGFPVLNPETGRPRVDPRTGRQVRTGRRDCAACAEEAVR